MVRSPRCAHNRAQPRSGTRAGGRLRRHPRQPHRRPRKKRKKEGERPLGGRAGGGGQEPLVPGRKFHGRGRGVPSPVPAPPKIIWKLLPTSSGTSDTFLYFETDKALSRESPGLPSGKREGLPRAALPRPPSDPARNHRRDGCHRGPPGRLGLQGARPRRAPALVRARLVLRWVPRIYI